MSKVQMLDASGNTLGTGGTELPLLLANSHIAYLQTTRLGKVYPTSRCRWHDLAPCFAEPPIAIPHLISYRWLQRNHSIISSKEGLFIT